MAAIKFTQKRLITARAFAESAIENNVDMQTFEYNLIEFPKQSTSPESVRKRWRMEAKAIFSKLYFEKHSHLN